MPNTPHIPGNVPAPTSPSSLLLLLLHRLASLAGKDFLLVPDLNLLSFRFKTATPHPAAALPDQAPLPTLPLERGSFPRSRLSSMLNIHNPPSRPILTLHARIAVIFIHLFILRGKNLILARL